MIDFSTMVTESQNSATMELDCMSALEIVRIMNQEDKKIPDAMAAALPNIAEAAECASRAIIDGGRVIYVGAGTSGRLGVLDAVECVPTFGVSREQVTAVMAGGAGAFMQALEGAEDDAAAGVEALKDIRLSGKDFVIGIAASGRTPYVCAALEYAAAQGCRTAALACNPDSRICSMANIPIEVIVGPEILTGSTRLKAGTAQKMVLNMISTAAMVLCGKVYKNLMVDVIQTNEKLHRRAENIVVQATGVSSDAAGTALREAAGKVKTAVTMILANTSATEAESLLDKHHGFVRVAVDGKGQ